jgi:hypothetical protein
MNRLIVYRILSVLVNIFCIFIAITLVFGLFLMISNPGFALGFFMMLAVVLYAWYANKFLRIVLNPQQFFTKRQKDWLQVNAIVALIFSILLATQSIAFIKDPKLVEEAFKQMPVQSPTDLIVNTSKVMLTFALILLVHVIWTYTLIRQHKDLIESDAKPNDDH